MTNLPYCHLDNNPSEDGFHLYRPDEGKMMMLRFQSEGNSGETCYRVVTCVTWCPTDDVYTLFGENDEEMVDYHGSEYPAKDIRVFPDPFRSPQAFPTA